MNVIYITNFPTQKAIKVFTTLKDFNATCALKNIKNQPQYCRTSQSFSRKIHNLFSGVLFKAHLATSTGHPRVCRVDGKYLKLFEFHISDSSNITSVLAGFSITLK